MTDSAWAGLVTPGCFNAVSARRVDADLAWDFFWARSSDRNYLLMLRHGSQSSPRDRLPQLKGIDVVDTPSGGADDVVLVLKLRDASQLDIFERLCRDIVGSTYGAASEREAVAAALGRTWRWHHLLRGGSDERLSPNEQQGLIGELLVLAPKPHPV